MTTDNPYNAPSATLVTAPAPLEGDVAQAVEGFIATRTFIRVLAILSFVVLGFSLLAMAATAVMPSPMPQSSRLIGVGTIVFLYGFLGLILFRLASPLYALAENKTWDNVTLVLQRMTQTWMMGIVAYVLGFFGGFAMRFATPMAVIAGATPTSIPTDAVSAATQLRNVLRIFVGIGVFSAIANVVVTAVAPMASQMALGAGFIWGSVVVGIFIQGFVLFFVWRHVPALSAFIAQPSATTLAQVAHAHRMLWRLVLIFVIVMIGLVIVGSIAAVVMALMMTHK